MNNSILNINIKKLLVRITANYKFDRFISQINGKVLVVNRVHNLKQDIVIARGAYDLLINFPRSLVTVRLGTLVGKYPSSLAICL